jgi:hypothetical protein
MSKAEHQELMDSMRRNTDNQFFRNLVDYLSLRLRLHKDMLVNAVDVDEIKRLQGRCLELSEMLRALQRPPIQAQSTGSFN